MQTLLATLAVAGVGLLLFVGGVAVVGLVVWPIFRLTAEGGRPEPPVLRQAAGNEAYGLRCERIRTSSVGRHAAAVQRKRRIAA